MAPAPAWGIIKPRPKWGTILDQKWVKVAGKDNRLNVRLSDAEYRAIELAAARWGPGTQSDLGRQILRDWIAAQDAGPMGAEPALSAAQAQAIVNALDRIEAKLDLILNKQ